MIVASSAASNIAAACCCHSMSRCIASCALEELWLGVNASVLQGRGCENEVPAQGAQDQAQVAGCCTAEAAGSKPCYAQTIRARDARNGVADGAPCEHVHQGEACWVVGLDGQRLHLQVTPAASAVPTAARMQELERDSAHAHPALLAPQERKVHQAEDYIWRLASRMVLGAAEQARVQA